MFNHWSRTFLYNQSDHPSERQVNIVIGKWNTSSDCFLWKIKYPIFVAVTLAALTLWMTRVYRLVLWSQQILRGRWQRPKTKFFYDQIYSFWYVKWRNSFNFLSFFCCLNFLYLLVSLHPHNLSLFSWSKS